VVRTRPDCSSSGPSKLPGFESRSIIQLVGERGSFKVSERPSTRVRFEFESAYDWVYDLLPKYYGKLFLDFAF
jgi:hypothetical protein